MILYYLIDITFFYHDDDVFTFLLQMGRSRFPLKETH